MTEINIEYQGALRCVSTHKDSGAILLTDAPKDNHGKGEGFSPTDLVATALGTCILTTMGIVAQMIDVDIAGAKITVHKEMATTPPRRIVALPVTIDIATPLDDAQKERLIKAAMGCPVKHSLHPDIEVKIDFRWAS
jgi:putative redox protein